MSTSDEFRVEKWWPLLTLDNKLHLRAQGSGPLDAEMAKAITAAGGMRITTIEYGPDVTTIPAEDWAWIKNLHSE
jgi:hypothetical protein